MHFKSPAQSAQPMKNVPWRTARLANRLSTWAVIWRPRAMPSSAASSRSHFILCLYFLIFSPIFFVFSLYGLLGFWSPRLGWVRSVPRSIANWKMFYGLMPLTRSSRSHLLKYATVVTFEPHRGLPRARRARDYHFFKEIQFYVEKSYLSQIIPFSLYPLTHAKWKWPN